jgi:hypothetical protein
LTTLFTSDPQVNTVAPDSKTLNGIIYSAVPAGQTLMAIYRGTTINPASSIQLKGPTFESVHSIQCFSDGDVLVVGDISGKTYAVIITPTTTTTVDEVTDASISTDGTVVVYSKFIGEEQAIRVYRKATATAITIVPTGNNITPQISHDNQWVVFSREVTENGITQFDLYRVPIVGGTIQRLTASADLTEFGPCYDSRDQKIAYAAWSSTTGSGIYVLTGGFTSQVVSDDWICSGVYWSDAVGRTNRNSVNGIKCGSALSLDWLRRRINR